MSKRVDSHDHDHDHDLLERALGRLGEDVVFPKTPNFIAPLWRGTTELPLAQSSRPSRSVIVGRWPLAALATLAAVALIVALPGARSTVAGWLEIAGIRIETGADPQTAVPVSFGGDLFLGRPVSLTEAQAAVTFEILALTGLAVGEPEIYLDHRDDTPVISLVYPASKSLPPIGETGAGLLLTQFVPAGDTDAYIKRTAMDAAPEFLIVNGSSGAWIEDGSLAIPGDTARADVERPSAHVLIWGADEITIRMETTLTRDEALAIARTLAPVTPPAPSPPGER